MARYERNIYEICSISATRGYKKLRVQLWNRLDSRMYWILRILQKSVVTSYLFYQLLIRT